MVSLRLFRLFTNTLLFFTAFTAAFPWSRFLPDIDSLVVRQNNNNNNENSSGSSTATPAATSSAAQKTDSPSSSASESATGSASGSATGSASGSQSASASGSVTASKTKSKSGGATTSSNSTSTSYDARLPVGGISLITPAIASGAQYFKVGEDVTFAWNYTSLKATPTAINIMASCYTNAYTYTIAMNQSADVTSVVWDTGSYQETAAVPFPVASYTLIIYDADTAITNVAGAGYLGTYDSYIFAMYTPQAYTPLNEFVCVTCSGALSNMEKLALKFMFGTAAITVLSFTWFIGGLNVIW